MKTFMMCIISVGLSVPPAVALCESYGLWGFGLAIPVCFFCGAGIAAVFE